MTYMDLPQNANAASRVDAPMDSRQNAERDGHQPPRTSRHGAKMRIAPWYLAALAPFAAIGYSGACISFTRFDIPEGLRWMKVPFQVQGTGQICCDNSI